VAAAETLRWILSPLQAAAAVQREIRTRQQPLVVLVVAVQVTRALLETTGRVYLGKVTTAVKVTTPELTHAAAVVVVKELRALAALLLVMAVLVIAGITAELKPAVVVAVRTVTLAAQDKLVAVTAVLALMAVAAPQLTPVLAAAVQVKGTAAVTAALVM
jgi:hypothetical protein